MVLKRTLHIFGWTVAFGIVTLAVALSMARLLLPSMSDYRAQIESVAAEVFKRPVNIGSLDAAWHAFSPVLKLNDVIVEDPLLPGGRIAIDEVEVAVDVVESLLQGKWRTTGIKVIGTRLDLSTDIRHSPQAFPLQAVLDWLIPQDSIAVEKVQLVWRDPGLFDVPIRLSDLSAKLVNEGPRHQLLLEAKLPMALGDSIQIAADLQGRGNDVTQWRGTLYLNTSDLQLPAFRPLMMDSGVIAKGATNLELWVGLVNSRPVWGSGNIAMQKPQVQNASADAQGIEADSLSARFYWREYEHRWRIGISDFELQRDEQEVWPTSSFDLAVESGEETRLRGHASLLMLDELNSILPLLPWVDDNALAMLDRLQPTGLMRDAEFEFRHRTGEEPKFAVRSAIENLTLAANSGLPGVTGVSGRVEGNLQAGHLRLNTTRAELVLPQVFSQPLSLTSLSGDVHWQRFRNMFRIETRRLQVESGPLALESRWQLDWSYDQAAPWLDLQLAARPLPLNSISDYLPTEAMPAKSVRWLQQAFKAGTADNVRVLLQGRLDEMPFDERQGRFEARFDFEDVILDYHPTWGQLDELDGNAVFSGRSMQVTGRSARILDSPVERVVAIIEDLGMPLLQIDGTVGGTFAGMLEYVRNSPLKSKFGALVDAVDSTGDARLQLNMNIPLKRGLGQIGVSGDVALAGNDLLPKQSEIGLTDIQGKLHFSKEGLSVKKARARVLGQPVALSVYKQGEAGASETVVDIQGKLKLIELIRKQNPPLAPYLSGDDTRWQALLKIRNQSLPEVARVGLELRSDLAGVAVSLPQPFGKRAGETRPLLISWAPGKEARYPFEVNYGDDTKARVLLSSNRQPRKAVVHFGSGSGELPAHDGIHFSGHLPVFDLGLWLPVFKSLTGTGGRKLSPSINLETDVFRFGSAEVAQISVSSEYTDPWHFTVAGKGASGWVRWIQGGRSLPSRLLAKLDVLAVDSQAESQQPTGAADPMQLTDLPELNAHVEDLRWGTRKLGQVSLVSRRTRQGVHFETLRLESPAVMLDGGGDWLAENGSQFTRFHVQVTDGDLAQLSALLGSKGAVKGGKLSGDIRLSWPGSPADMSLSSVEGEFDLEARDGRLENVEEGAGKLLSLFSLNSLQRRLNLDFRDVVREGFSFDSMKGHFVVRDGDAFTNDFSIHGTSVTIDISGRTGLVDRDYDQLVTVTPQVTSTLPIAGAIAGGPAVGAAVFLADKLVGERFNRLTRVEYQVTGSWDEPVYTKIKKEAPEPLPEDTDSDDF